MQFAQQDTWRLTDPLLCEVRLPQLKKKKNIFTTCLQPGSLIEIKQKMSIKWNYAIWQASIISGKKKEKFIDRLPSFVTNFPKIMAKNNAWNMER